MLPSKHLTRVAAIVVTAAIGSFATAAIASPGQGVTFTTLTEAEFKEVVDMNSDRIKFQTKDTNITRVQKAEFAVASDSGWHHHPGVLIAVVHSGSVTVWDGACGKKTYGPGLPLGEVFVEGDNMLMKASSSEGATEYITHTVPFGSPPVYRIEDPVPFCDGGPETKTAPTEHRMR
jgi:hypothetical protein